MGKSGLLLSTDTYNTLNVVLLISPTECNKHSELGKTSSGPKF